MELNKWRLKFDQKIVIVVLSIILFSSNLVKGQDFDLKEKKNKKQDVLEIYHVLRNQKKIRQGLYLRYLKKQVIVNGYYDNDDKVGIWKYYDGLRRVQLEYDYDKKKVIDYESFQDTTHYSQPPLLLGSTIEMKYKINKKIKYPQEAWHKGFHGEIIVGLKIDTLGVIQGLFIVKGCAESLNDEALRVVEMVAREYQWLPAIKDDKYVNSQYLIPIQFEMRRRLY